MKKSLVFVIALLFNFLPASGNEIPLHLQLEELNAEWSQRVPDLSILNATESLGDDEISLIRTHLLLVVSQLENADITNLNEDQRRQRDIHISTLRKYALEGQFPQNIFVGGRRPVFIDPWGSHCAVGHLIQSSGNRDLAKAINANHQLDYIRDIKTAGLTEWQNQSGLTFAELELIQPSYAFRFKSQIIYPKEIEDLILGDSSSIKEAVLADKSLLSARCGGKTLVHYAAAAGDLELLKWLVERGADLNAISKREAEKTGQETRTGMGKIKTCTVSWNSPTIYHENYYQSKTGHVLSSIRGTALLSVLQDMSGGLEGKSATYYATAHANPNFHGSYHRVINKQTNPEWEKLKKNREQVANWLKEQTSTYPNLSQLSDANQ